MHSNKYPIDRITRSHRLAHHAGIFSPKLSKEKKAKSVGNLMANATDIEKAPLKARRILLVEDDKIIQTIHEKFLKLMGYQVEVAESGCQALAMFPNGYDLILLDIGLPDIDGLTVCSILRDKNQAKIPIIALTAYGEEIKKECFAVGIDEVIGKPVEFARLQQILNKWLMMANHSGKAGGNLPQ